MVNWRYVIVTFLCLWSVGTTLHAESLFNPNVTKKQLSDDDQDGVINVRDKCPDTPPRARVDNNGCHEITTKLLSVEMNVLL